MLIDNHQIPFQRIVDELPNIIYVKTLKELEDTKFKG